MCSQGLDGNGMYAAILDSAKQRVDVLPSHPAIFRQQLDGMESPSAYDNRKACRTSIPARQRRHNAAAFLHDRHNVWRHGQLFETTYHGFADIKLARFDRVALHDWYSKRGPVRLSLLELTDRL